MGDFSNITSDPWGAFKRVINPESYGNYFGHLTDESEGTKQQRAALNQQAGLAGGFADQAQGRYGQLGNESYKSMDYLRGLASGQNSVSAEQLRQGLQQQMAQQQSMAAGAPARDQAMAARQAMNNQARASYGMSGQQAAAGLQERNDAQRALADMINRQREQELQASLQGRQTAIQGYQNVKPEGSWMDKWAGPLQGGFSAMAMSDERLKTDIEDGDEKAKSVLEGLKAYNFKYKNEKHGKGEQFGVMAQQLESSGLGHAVVETPEGKAVHGGKLAASSLALTAALAKRVVKLEGKGK